MKKLKISYNSPVILTFCFLSLIALVLGFVTKGKSNELFFMTYRSSLLNPLTYIRAFGHTLGHSGWDHYIGNISLILVLGSILESKYGSGVIFSTIMVTAAATSILNAIFFPNTAIIGASGIVFCFILLCSVTNIKKGEIPLTLIFVAIIYLGKEITQGLFSADNISNFGHLIGGLCGSMIGFIFGTKDEEKPANNELDINTWR